MRSYKKLMPIILTVAFVASAFYYFQTKSEARAEYDMVVAEARHYAQLGVYSQAADEYQKALSLQRSLPLLLEMGEVFVKENDLGRARRWYEDILLNEYPKEAETYYFGATVAEKREDYDDLFNIYEECQKRNALNAELKDLMEKYQYQYKLEGMFDDVGTFGTSSGIAPVKYNERWGAIGKSGGRKVAYEFKKIGVFTSLAPAITEDDKAVCINAEGNVLLNENSILEHDPDFGHVVEFGNIYDGILPAYNGEVWNYYDQESHEKLFGGYIDATSIYDGVGAVKDRDQKWRLVSSDGEFLSDETYDEVLRDGKGIICRNGVLIVRNDSSYFLIDKHGNKLVTDTYEDARPFSENTLAAIKKNGKWLFIDQKGSEQSFGDYEDAHSFSNGLAGVKKNDMWGFIDTNGQLVINNEFFEVGPFTSSGVAFVKPRSSTWNLLMLYKDNHE